MTFVSVGTVVTPDYNYSLMINSFVDSALSHYCESKKSHFKKWVVILNIRCGYLTYNIAQHSLFVTTTSQGICRISVRNISQVTIIYSLCITLSHRGSHVHNPTVLTILLY